MSTVITKEQDKDSFLQYQFDWSDFGEAIATSAWVTDPELTLSSQALNGTTSSVWVQGGVSNKWYAITNTVTGSVSGKRDQKTIRLFIKDDTATVTVNDGTALFPNRANAVDQVRRDNLMLAAQNHFAGVELSTDMIWNKLYAAEAEIATQLRVKLQPTAFFPVAPTQEQITALNGMPWEEDPPYDYEPDMFQGEKWGFISTRHQPIISVTELKYAYPSTNQFAFTFPPDWLKMDKKYGQIRIVPNTIAAPAMIGSFMMNMLAAGRTVPHILHLTYVAGLTNPARDYPQLVDAVKKLAVLKLIEDSFPAQSGSISADGLSQSMSIDISKYHESIDIIINGRSGSNGGLKAAIHGVILGVM